LALAEAAAADVLRAWGRLGYPRRALRLREAAAGIVRVWGGDVPDSQAALETLPGIGEYTAAAVAAFAFGRRAVVVDTNVRRVLARAVGGEALPAPSPTAADRRRAAALLPADAAASVTWNVAVMELGALVCTARSPRCGECPVREGCGWLAAGCPPDSYAERRRAQGWAGTDRQVRGVMMAALRAADAAGVARRDLLALWPADGAQAQRAAESLVADGLAVRVDAAGGERDAGSRYQLPEGCDPASAAR
jgi:A/G-specific adenine glycosylase